MNRIIILFFFTLELFAFEDTDMGRNLLGITEKSQKIIIKNGINITRKLTDCAKNRGWIQPLVPYEGINPITELEVLDAIGDQEILLVDMRMEQQYLSSTIPTSINAPYTDIDLYMSDFGCLSLGDGWDCSYAKKIYGFCNGPSCSQSPTAMRLMVRRGYPVEKIYYYRGGMFSWEALGLTTVVGEF